MPIKSRAVLAPIGPGGVDSPPSRDSSLGEEELRQRSTISAKGNATRCREGDTVTRLSDHGEAMPNHQNTVHVGNRLLKGDGDVRLLLRSLVDFRAHHLPVSEPLDSPFTLSAMDDRYEPSPSPSMSWSVAEILRGLVRTAPESAGDRAGSTA